MTATYTLFPYQEQGISDIRQSFRVGKKRVLLCMPTGAGKTLTASEMVRGNDQRRKRMLWVTDREELAEQASEAFDRAGVPHSFIMADQQPDRFGRAHVCTIQSFLARNKRDTFGERIKWLPETVDLIVIDEAHRTEADSFQQLLAEYPDAYVVGLTATPMRKDGKGLGRTYDDMVVPVTMAELLEMGRLVPARYFIPSESDFSALQRSRSGEFTAADLARWADDNPQLVGDAVENFARICPERRAVAFPPDIRTSIALRDRFTAAGINAVHIDGTMRKGLRRELMAGFRSGEYQVLTSVNIAIEGLDVPDVSAVINLRPTKSERIWVQAVGRGLRSFEGKTDCIVLDHAGVLMEFGPAEQFTPPPLDSNKGQGGKGQKAKKKRKPAEVICEGTAADGQPCRAVLIGTNICPECGHVHEFEPAGNDLAVIPGDLQELTSEGRQAALKGLEEEKRWYSELLGYAINRGHKPGSAGYRFEEKFGKRAGSWRHHVQPTPPSAEVLAWIKSRAIAYHKAKERDQRRGAAA